MAEPSTPTRDHQKIGNEIDAIYNAAVMAAMFLQEYLVHRKGNPNEVFSQFYEPFVALFVHTSVMREMEKAEYDTLINDIDKWMQKSTKKHDLLLLMHEGLRLFRRYQAAVIKTGAVVVKRE
jgi:hypothetical protein